MNEEEKIKEEEKPNFVLFKKNEGLYITKSENFNLDPHLKQRIKDEEHIYKMKQDDFDLTISNLKKSFQNVKITDRVYNFFGLKEEDKVYSDDNLFCIYLLIE